MNPRLRGYSVAEQRDILRLRQSKSIVKNRDERAGCLHKLLKLVEDKEVLADYERQL
jgi:hypothetical protein